MRTRATSVRYPNLYTWFVFLASLDVMLTYMVLQLGGYEANELAATVMRTAGWHGMIAYKFVLVTVVILLCELIARRDAHWGRRLGAIGIGMTCVPVVLAFVLLATRLTRF